MYGGRAPKGELCNKVCMYVCMYERSRNRLVSSYIMSYSRSLSSLLKYLAAPPCFAASYLKFTRLAGIAHYITTINTNHQSDSKNKIEFKKNNILKL